jgi:TLD
MDATPSLPATSLKAQPQRPNPISLRAQSNVETKAAARKGLLNIMMNKFSSTPLSLHESNEFNNHPDGDKEMMNLRHKRLHSTANDKTTICGDSLYMRHELDMYQYDASLTKSERDYIRHIILSGDTNSIQSASVVLQNEDVFPVQHQLVVSNSSGSKSSSNNCEANDYDDSCGDVSVIANDDEDDDDDTATTVADDFYRDEKKEDSIDNYPGSNVTRKIDPRANMVSGATTSPPASVRDSMIQQQLFRLHETNKDLQPNELIQRMSRQNSILTMDDSTTTTATAMGTNYKNNSMSSSRRFRSMSPPPITEGEILLQSARSLDLENDMITRTQTTTISEHDDSMDRSVPISVECLASKKDMANPSMEEGCDDSTRILAPPPPSLNDAVINIDATIVNSSWNPFDDISSWLDGSQGVEVTATTSSQTTVLSPTFDALQTALEDTVPSMPNLTTSVDDTIISHTGTYIMSSSSSHQPFRILGTSADDVSCHPHVLSPPLMESLLAFVPEYHSTHHQHHYSTGITAAGGAERPTYLSTVPESTNVIVGAVSDPLSDNSDGKNVSLDCRQFTCQSDTTTSNVDETKECNSESVTSNMQQRRQQDYAASSLMHSSLSSHSSPSNFWLKYSLVRDGPGLWTFLRQVRASAICILAIETTEGHVLGAYTSQPWRLSKGWYGNKDTFLWKMRRSRLETAGKSILQQICQESEVQVYPYRTGNVAIQYCSNKCLMLGQGEVIPSPKKHNPDKPPPTNVGKHYGYALYLDKELKSGTTSSSETFGNPCLLDSSKRGARFNVANVEVWTLTPHMTVADAEQSELSNLFLDGGRDSAHRLNFMNILVGGPI